MGLTAKQRKKLTAEGWSRRDLRELEDSLADDDEGAASGGADSSDDSGEGGSDGGGTSGRRVVILEGDQADSFLERYFGSESSSEDEGSSDEGETSDEADEDEKPRRGPGYFKDKAS